MNSSRFSLRPGMTAAAIAALLAGCAGGDDNNGSTSNQASSAVPSILSTTGCAGMAAAALPNVTIQGAVPVAAGTVRPAGVGSGDFLPAHCVVTGLADPYIGTDNADHAIGFELRLPTAWSGQFMFQGGGGNDGVINPALGTNTGSMAASAGISAYALARGFAVVATDGGHQGTDAASYGKDARARVDHAYNAYDRTAQIARQLIEKYYGKQPDHSYFLGCSGGGRQGMMFSQRFPSYFDGIVASAPAMKVASGASIAAAWESQAYSAIAPRDAAGNPVIARALSDADLALVSKGILAACDAKDGAVDGMVQDPGSCNFDPALLQCSGAKTDACLSADQAGALKKAFAGPRDSSGASLYSSWPWDIGINNAGWRSWKLGTSQTSVPNSRYVTLIANAMAYEFFTPHDAGFDLFKFNFDTDPSRLAAYSAVYDTYRTTDLRPYTSHGGKMIFFHGGGDPIFSANDTVDYYQRLAATAGGIDQAQSFARLFIVPGMNHCSGGPATDAYDGLAAIVNWVEKGTAPDSVGARGTAFFQGRSRPLCPYPKTAHYKGSGSIEDAASFSCE
jgi:Tannase and feruloyl esterase